MFEVQREGQSRTIRFQDAQEIEGPLASYRRVKASIEALPPEKPLPAATIAQFVGMAQMLESPEERAEALAQIRANPREAILGWLERGINLLRDVRARVLMGDFDQKG